ncbi:tyrosine-type recombinase/integrase [Rhizobium mongolense]|uniref:tyrosine-type recombinase/integrase n=1 Tax=Rhizobium mongolense TaxID=57676 RepID=UPI0035560BE9
MKLSAVALATMPQGDYTDFVVPGLVFRVGKKRRTWIIRFRAGGVRRKEPLGYFVPNAPAGTDSLGLAEARQKAREILSRVDAGVPVAEQPKPVHPKDALTLGDLIDDYEEMKIKQGKRGVKSLPEAMRAVRKGLGPYLTLPAAQFSKADLRAARDKVAKSSLQMSDRFLAYAGPVFKWAAQEDKIPVNFAPDLRRVGPGLVRRKRVLSDDEIRAIWYACAEMETDTGKDYGRLIRFLLATGQRREEGSLLRHGRIIGGYWRLEEEETKAGRAHKVKLPALALDQIGRGEPGTLIFPGKGGVPLSGWSKLKTQLDKASGVTGWRLHDLRRTCSTRMESMVNEDGRNTIPREVIEAVLNHSVPGVAGSYLHHTFETEKARAWELWATMLQNIIAENSRTEPVKG